MGYIYAREFSGGRMRNVLACDVCSGTPARKIKCPYGWCQAYAACANCKAKVRAQDHSDCKRRHDELESDKAALKAGNSTLTLYLCKGNGGELFHRIREDRQSFAACCIFNKTWVDAPDIDQLRAWGNAITTEISPELAREEFETMVKAAMSNSRVKLGNVEFWIDAEGPWAGQLSFDLPSNQWNVPAIQRDLIRSMYV